MKYPMANIVSYMHSGGTFPKLVTYARTITTSTVDSACYKLKKKLEI